MLARRVARTRASFRIPRTNHIFKPRPRTWPTATRSSRPISAGAPFVPELMRALVSFVKGTNF